jgi:hypothetical protein
MLSVEFAKISLPFRKLSSYANQPTGFSLEGSFQCDRHQSLSYSRRQGASFAIPIVDSL